MLKPGAIKHCRKERRSIWLRATYRVQKGLKRGSCPGLLWGSPALGCLGKDIGFKVWTILERTHTQTRTRTHTNTDPHTATERARVREREPHRHTTRKHTDTDQRHEHHRHRHHRHRHQTQTPTQTTHTHTPMCFSLFFARCFRFLSFWLCSLVGGCNKAQPISSILGSAGG